MGKSVSFSATEIRICYAMYNDILVIIMAGNAKVAKDIRLYECKNCVVHSVNENKVVVQGLDGYIVAGKNGQLLVCSLKEEQRIKEFGE